MRYTQNRLYPIAEQFKSETVHGSVKLYSNPRTSIISSGLAYPGLTLPGDSYPTRPIGREDQSGTVRTGAGQLGPLHKPQNFTGNFLLKIEDLWKEHVVS